MNLNQYAIIKHLDRALPVYTILAHTQALLESCGWKLEIDNEIIEIPKNVELVVRSRSFIKAELDDVFLDDHFEAVVLLGKEVVGENVRALYGVLRLYFNPEGQFVSEDRYDKYH